jgi:hypothetical protein
MIREDIWLRKLEAFPNDIEMRNFSVCIITIFTNYACGTFSLKYWVWWCTPVIPAASGG